LFYRATIAVSPALLSSFLYQVRVERLVLFNTNRQLIASFSTGTGTHLYLRYKCRWGPILQTRPHIRTHPGSGSTWQTRDRRV